MTTELNYTACPSAVDPEFELRKHFTDFPKSLVVRQDIYWMFWHRVYRPWGCPSSRIDRPDYLCNSATVKNAAISTESPACTINWFTSWIKVQTGKYLYSSIQEHIRSHQIAHNLPPTGKLRKQYNDMLWYIVNAWAHGRCPDHAALNRLFISIAESRPVIYLPLGILPSAPTTIGTQNYHVQN